MIVLSIFRDALFAALAGMGFGAISNPPRRAFPLIALLAAAGHVFRYVLMTFVGWNIATSSLCGGLIIGFGSLWLGKYIRTPMTVLSIPALLPMIPGKYAYRMVFSQLMFLEHMDDVCARTRYMDMFFSNAMVTCSVVFMLAIGAVLPMFMFPKRAFSMSREKKL
ncbi:MAG: threonine/serine exporter family protein [Paludibacter sp.]|nr:threonine/serine exporter family protein [Bacteroidales bacterium]MCM1069917.1 threonine/serine exporter family protein [Prevotella sp.]MCM1354666.1 threonine/serine exporter family protein [Bacteroides sp.]MCM1443493.1 threonine/serine exporter family protein [Muribaculum sp.]MCM1482599.1 threonine/serine exporter family protein [Paludibacter sp.]